MRLAELLDRLAGRFLLLWGWRRAAAAFIAGALSALAMPPFLAMPVLFITFPILVWLMDATAADPAPGLLARLRRGFATGWTFGFGYFLAGLWWIGSAFLVEADKFAWMLPFAVTLLPAVLAVFWGIGTAVAGLIWRDGWRRILVLAACLSLAEYLRGTLFTGFPWNTIGYGAMPVPALMQVASLAGLYGVTALAIPVFSLAALRPLPHRDGARGAKAFAIACLLLFAAQCGYGAWRLSGLPVEFRSGVMLRIVQPAIDQAEKWSPAMEQRTFRTLIDLSSSQPLDGAAGAPRITHLVWPESAFPFVLTERRDALAALSQLLPSGTELVAGALRVEEPAAGNGRERVFNSVYTINDAGEITGAADKVHLVPFGEYLPFQEYAERLGLAQLTHLHGGFAAGAARRLLDGGKAGRFLPLVCYEIIFPGEAVSSAGRPDFILNVTNDAWFGPTPGPYQHFHQAVIRGVEEGLPVVRAANNGISSVTDAAGRSVARLGLGERGFIDAQLPLFLGKTTYARYGDRIFFLIVGLFLAVSIFTRRKS